MRLSAARTAVLATAAVLATGAPLAIPGSAHADIEQDFPCAELENNGTEETYRTEAVNAPLQLLGIAAAQAEVEARVPGDRLAGSGVTVAVLDSGVYADSPLLDVTTGPSYANQDELLDYHGTAVAGLVAGKPRGDEPTGVAPGARILDVRVYDDDDPTQDEGAAPVETDRLVEGVRWLADHAERLQVGVATIALRVERSDELERQIRRLHAADVVIVAASGNRPTLDSDPLMPTLGTLAPGEDAAPLVYPAGFTEEVVAVTATNGGSPDEAAGADVRDHVLQSSAIDVAAPTWNAVSLGMDGSTCLLPDIATSWAAAQVSGVVALLRAAHPDDTADQIVARLTETASGSTADRNVLVGAGVVQPLAAVARPLTPDEQGDLERLDPQEGAIPAAQAPRPESDLLAGARENAVWFGLLGGCALVLALLLRPILARRRT